MTKKVRDDDDYVMGVLMPLLVEAGWNLNGIAIQAVLQAVNAADDVEQKRRLEDAQQPCAVCSRPRGDISWRPLEPRLCGLCWNDGVRLDREPAASAEPGDAK
jgi:hypothetical protein